MLTALSILALVAIVVVASQEPGRQVATDQVAVATAHPDEGCTGQCATCPNAKTEGYPGAATCEAVAQCPAGASVDAEKCVGCVRCVNVSPEAFRMNPETGRAEVIPGASAEDIARGAQACPVHAVIR